MVYTNQVENLAGAIELYSNKTPTCVVTSTWLPYSDSWSGDTANAYHVYACFRYDTNNYTILGLLGSKIHVGEYHKGSNPKISWHN